MSDEKMIKVSKLTGVYYRESLSKRFSGKVDRCFYISFKNGSKKVWEKVGWVSEGYSAQMAANIRAERMRSLRHGEELPLKKKEEITFGQLWEYYDRWLENGKGHPQDDRSRYSNHLERRFSKKALSKIAPLDLEELKNELLNKNLSPATVKHVLVLVRQMYNKGVSWGLWQGENPIKKIKLPKLNNRRERYLTHDEASTILDGIKKVSQQLFEISLMSLYTGMRASEVFGLKWGHCNFSEGIIHVADPKNNNPRKVYMTNAVRTMLENKKMGKPGDLVFKSRGGDKITQISNAFDRMLTRLKLNDGIEDPRQRVYFHTLRHTFASWLAIKGTPILTIKELLGHKSLAMTERYSHLSPDHKRKAAEGIDELLNGKSQEIERYLTKDEAGLLFEELQASNKQLYEISLLSLSTGLRIEEISSLQWGHCSFAEGTIHVGDPNSTESRKVYMTNAIRNMLENKKPAERDELLFNECSIDHLMEITSAFDEVVTRLQLNDGSNDPRQQINIHSLRHTFASWLALTGTPISTIKDLLGYESLAMTEKYARLMPDQRKKAIEGIGDFLTSTSEVTLVPKEIMPHDGF